MGKIGRILRCAASVLTLLSISVSSFPIFAKAKIESDTKRMIALTFDDGPHGKYTDEILDILGEYGIKATFFVVGVCAEKYPQIIAREIAEGHEIGNHTYSHIHINGASDSVIAGEIDKTEQLIFESSGYSTTLFRPPEGVCNDTVRSVAKNMNYSLVLWTVDTRDWIPSSKESIINTVMSEVDGGEIILMHDYVAKNSNTPDALRVIIPKLLDMGYTFVTVSELIK
ncbi:MAG: polysaccharide deacetylase family protein [Clostridia bacterium]|nr:polysaccharide deacetylase family protein [Clostridia bacterium]MBQ8743501.1 polysaccharide deacetylase family protein [Clostridia bacterium]